MPHNMGFCEKNLRTTETLQQIYYFLKHYNNFITPINPYFCVLIKSNQL